MRHQDSHEVVDSLGNLVERQLEKGVYKKNPNNPRWPDGEVHQYCPPEHVESEMDRLLDMAEQQAQRSWPVEVRASWLHHRFTQIHPYSDGNGRIARSLASLILLKDGFLPFLVPNSGWSSEYLPALEASDLGNLRPFVECIVEHQRRALVTASKGVTTQGARSHEPQSVNEAIDHVVDILYSRELIIHESWQRVSVSVNNLHHATRDRMFEINNRMNTSMKGAMQVAVRADFRYELTLPSQPEAWILRIVFDHCEPSRGLFMVDAAMSKGPDVRWRPTLNRFLLTFAEPVSEAVQRYIVWLDECLRQAILEWSKSL